MSSEKLSCFFFQWLLLNLGCFTRLEEIRTDRWGHDVPKTVLLVTVTDDTDDFDDGLGKVGVVRRVAGAIPLPGVKRGAIHIGRPEYGLGLLAALSKSKWCSPTRKLPKSLNSNGWCASLCAHGGIISKYMKY